MNLANRPRPLSDLVPGLTREVFGPKNALFGKMLAQWAEIAGLEMAARTVPTALAFTRGKKTEARPQSPKAVLHLSVQPGYALELSYQKTLLVERLNVFFGYPAISDIKIVQNSNVMNNKSVSPPLLRPLSPAKAEKIKEMVANIQETDLQIALENLGKAILSRV